MPKAVERDVERILTRLRGAIRERGYTQLEVQKALGWGRSHISRLLTRQQSLRVDHVHMILDVIGVQPGDFWAEVYSFRQPAPAADPRSQSRLDALIALLVQKRLVTPGELESAARESGAEGAARPIRRP